MNYIKKLQEENEQLKKQLFVINQAAIEQLQYFTLPKFQGTENDYAHIKTDVLGKIEFFRNASAQ